MCHSPKSLCKHEVFALLFFDVVRPDQTRHECHGLNQIYYVNPFKSRRTYGRLVFIQIFAENRIQSAPMGIQETMRIERSSVLSIECVDLSHLQRQESWCLHV